jgi:WD40 repeat protein
MNRPTLANRLIASVTLASLFLLPRIGFGEDAKAQLPKHRVLIAPVFVLDLALTHDGKVLFTIGRDREVRVWETAQPAQSVHITHELLYRARSALTGLAMHPDGKLLAVKEGENTIHFIDVPTRKLLNESIKHQEEEAETRGRRPREVGPDGLTVARSVTRSLDFSPDGKLFAVAWGNEVEIYDAGTRKLVERIPVYQMSAQTVLFRPSTKKDGNVSLVLFDSGKGAGQLWDVTNRKRVTFFFGEDKSLLSRLSFRSDGKILAGVRSPKADGRVAGGVYLWDFSGDLPRAILPNSRGYSVAFRPSSNHLVTSGFGINFWDVSTQKLQHLDFSGDAVPGAFSRDGNTMVAAGSDGMVLWDLSRFPAPPIGEVEGKPGRNRPEMKSTFRAWIEDLALVPKSGELQRITLEPLPGTDERRTTWGPQIAHPTHIFPSHMDMRLMVKDREAGIKDFHLGDVVEVSYSSRRFPSTHITLVEHNPARTRREEGFAAALKLLAPFRTDSEPLPTGSARRVDSVAVERRWLKRPAGDAQQHAAEEQAAAAIFKLVEEAPMDRQSFKFLTELMAMSNPEVCKQAAAGMIKHHLKNPEFKVFLDEPLFRAKAPDDLFERLLELKDVSEFHARSCIILANRSYHRAKRFTDKEATAAAIKHLERLRKDFPSKRMWDPFPINPPFGTSGQAAEVRLKELRADR